MDAVVLHRVERLAYSCPKQVLNGRIQNMDPRSMDHPCGPGPWTTSLDPVHGPLHRPPLILRDNAHKMAQGE